MTFVKNFGFWQKIFGVIFENIECFSKFFYNAETNFSIELALRAAKSKMKITEIPTNANERVHGQSQLFKIEKFILYNINAVIQIISVYFKHPKILD